MLKSVARGNRRSAPTAEAVVQANQTHIDALADVLVLEEDASSVEIDIARAHEQVVVLDTDGPVRSKANFHAHTDGATPTGCVGCSVHRDCGVKQLKLV